MDHQPEKLIAPDDVTEQVAGEATSPTGTNEEHGDDLAEEHGSRRERAEEDARQGTQG
jgi:hypothetical protein